MGVVAALVGKDLRLFRADKTAMVISVLVPVCLACFFGFIFGGMGSGTQVSKIWVLVVDLDGGATTREIFKSMSGSDSINPTKATLADARDQVRNGKVGVAVVFPKGFGDQAQRAMFYGEKPKLQLLIDPSKQTEAQVVQGKLIESIMQVVSRRAMSTESSGKNLDSAIAAMQASESPEPARIRALKDLKSSVGRLNATSGTTGASGAGGFSVPFDTTTEKIQAPQTDSSGGQVGRYFGGMAIQGLLFQAINAAMAILQDRKRGIYKRLGAAPISKGQLFLGKLLSSFIVTLLILFAVFLVGFAFFKIRISGSAIGFGLICVATAIMASSFGLFVAALGRTEEQSRGLSIMAVLFMCMLGGAWFPSFLMPKAMQTVAMVVPVRWAMEGFDAVTWRGLGLSSAMPAVGVLLGFTVAFSLFAAYRLRWA